MLIQNRTLGTGFIRSIMRVIATILVLWLITCQAVFGQTTLYFQNFNGVTAPDLPADWSTNTPQVVTNVQSPSSGYPGASGANNLRAEDCLPLQEFRSFEVSGISTVNRQGIGVSFGHRTSPAFVTPITLEWSSDGSNWNSISYIQPVNAWALFTSALLPSSAENIPNLRFRWSYVTQENRNCTAPPNFRIDDFRVTAQTVLPVELLSFTATRQDKTALLNWATASERNNDYFSVEHSADGLHYLEIGQLQGAADSDERLDYAFTHTHPAQGLNYYRLRQADFDGAYAYSPVRILRFDNAKGLDGAFLYPSPVTATLTLRLPDMEESDTHWQILDTHLRVVAEGTWAAGQQETGIAVDGFAAGWYVLQLIREQETAALRFVKQ